MRTASGTTVPLKAVADISFGQGPSKVRRYDQKRRVCGRRRPADGVASGTALEKIRALPIFKNLPTGRADRRRRRGASTCSELFTNFLHRDGAGILLVFAVLVLLFARVFQPITILSALPLSLGGAVLALALTGSPFLAVHVSAS